MESFKAQEFVILDVETTGLSPLTGDRVVEIAAVKIKNLQPVEYFHSLVDPERPLSLGAFMVNRISSEMLEGAPPSRDVLPSLTTFMGDAFNVGHNVKFDLKFIENEYRLSELPMFKERWALDTIKMAKMLLPELRTYALRHVSAYLEIPIRELHRAQADVHLTYKVFDDLLHRAFKKDIKDCHSAVKHFGFLYKPSTLTA